MTDCVRWAGFGLQLQCAGRFGDCNFTFEDLKFSGGRLGDVAVHVTWITDKVRGVDVGSTVLLGGEWIDTMFNSAPMLKKIFTFRGALKKTFLYELQLD